MKTFITIIVVLLSMKTFAQNMDLTPGLYQMKTKVMVNGKVMDANAEMKKAMAQQSKSMTPEMLQKMKSMNIHIPIIKDPNNIQICIKAEELTPESIAKSRKDKNCTYKTIKHTSKEMNTAFKCKDGTDAISNIRILNNKHFTTQSITKNPEKKKDHTSEISSEGKWVSAKCTKESINQSKGIFN